MGVSISGIFVWCRLAYARRSSKRQVGHDRMDDAIHLACCSMLISFEKMHSVEVDVAMMVA